MCQTHHSQPSPPGVCLCEQEGSDFEMLISMPGSPGADLLPTPHSYAGYLMGPPLSPALWIMESRLWAVVLPSCL